ncbi:IS1595 family transposase [Henriciella aquimarina]|uniref:IS1595 family transposase n=1 Tax=Henriciella aquimarina TaxID=545261 RepID=UPI0009FEE793|nr:IS1595 family transposase [Henriciella aquimarina]
MAQHFLLSAAARTLSLPKIYKAGEDAAYETFCNLRWQETDGEAVCPDCGCCETYKITTRRKFKCKACYRQFSVTTGTIFASHKLGFMDILAAIFLFVNGSKGKSAVQISRELDVQYKTAWVLCHKLREAMQDEYEGHQAKGEVEIDGAYFGGHLRPANEREDRKDRRLKEHQTGTRRSVIVARERKGRTLTFVAKAEAEGVKFARQRVAIGSILFADEARHWDGLSRTYAMGRINHQYAYSMDGKHTNWAESFFSRLRRMVQGQHHFVSPQYLYQYANHAAWLEDHRSEDNGTLVNRIVTAGLAAPVSRSFKGYWQRKAA